MTCSLQFRPASMGNFHWHQLLHGVYDKPTMDLRHFVFYLQT